MSDNRTPFEYSVLRYIHDVVTGEFLNIGLVIYSKPRRYLRAELLNKYRRITNTFPGADGEFFRQYINHLQLRFLTMTKKICDVQTTLLDELPDQLEQILAKILPLDDSSIRFSEVRSGFAANLNEIFSDLYNRLIEFYLDEIDKKTRDDEQVWNVYSRPLRELNLLELMQPNKITTRHDEIEFDYAWKNGRWNLIKPLSFDLATPTYIRRKAKTWLGTNLILDESDELSKIYYLLGGPRDQDGRLLQAYEDAKEILTTERVNYSIVLVEESQSESFAKEIKPQVETDTSTAD